MALALAACIAATAQPPRQRDDRRPPPIPPVFAILDTDHDRVLSAEEIEAAAGILSARDKNGDGEVSVEELLMPPPRDRKPPRKPEIPRDPPPNKPPVPPVIAALDVDHDGTVSAEELAGAPESMKVLDKNSDGELSPEELRPFGPPPPRDDGKNEGVE